MQALPIQPTPRVLSMDDFAFRRGRTYGSILVDLELHQAVDLLPDQSGSSFAEWLAAHPGVEIVTVTGAVSTPMAHAWAHHRPGKWLTAFTSYAICAM
jgi:transposase